MEKNIDPGSVSLSENKENETMPMEKKFQSRAPLENISNENFGVSELGGPYFTQQFLSCR